LAENILMKHKIIIKIHRYKDKQKTSDIVLCITETQRKLKIQDSFLTLGLPDVKRVSCIQNISKADKQKLSCTTNNYKTSNVKFGILLS